MFFSKKVSVCDADEFVNDAILRFLNDVSFGRLYDHKDIESFRKFLAEKIKTKKLYAANFSLSLPTVVYRKAFRGLIRIFYNNVYLYFDTDNVSYENIRRRKMFRIHKIKMSRESILSLYYEDKHREYLVKSGFKKLEKYKEKFALPEKESWLSFIYRETSRKFLYKNSLILCGNRLICIVTKYNLIFEYVRINQVKKSDAIIMANKILENRFNVTFDTKNYDEIIRRHLILNTLAGEL